MFYPVKLGSHQQCFGSVFTESGSRYFAESGFPEPDWIQPLAEYGSHPDPDPDQDSWDKFGQIL
jgi:hypothetical protein